MPRGRPRLYLRDPEDLWLEETARDRGCSRQEILWEAVEYYRTKDVRVPPSSAKLIEPDPPMKERILVEDRKWLWLAQKILNTNNGCDELLKKFLVSLDEFSAELDKYKFDERAPLMKHIRGLEQKLIRLQQGVPIEPGRVGFANEWEAAKYLNIPKPRLSRMIRQRQIPARKVGNEYVVPWLWLRKQSGEDVEE